MLFTNHFVNAADENNQAISEETRAELEERLENSLISIAYLSQKSQIDNDELIRLRIELEDTLWRLQQKPNPKTKIIYITPGGY